MHILDNKAVKHIVKQLEREKKVVFDKSMSTKHRMNYIYSCVFLADLLSEHFSELLKSKAAFSDSGMGVNLDNEVVSDIELCDVQLGEPGVIDVANSVQLYFYLFQAYIVPMCEDGPGKSALELLMKHPSHPFIDWQAYESGIGEVQGENLDVTESVDSSLTSQEPFGDDLDVLVDVNVEQEPRTELCEPADNSKSDFSCEMNKNIHFRVLHGDLDGLNDFSSHELAAFRYDGDKNLLMLAIEQDSLKLAKIALACGVDVSQQFTSSLTIVHECVRYEREDILYYLLSNKLIDGVMDTADKYDFYPALMAATYGFEPGYLMLQSFGADVDKIGPEGSSASEVALNFF
jgi:hypothetical protein